MGYSGVEFDPNLVSIDFTSSVGKVKVCKEGKGLIFDETLAKQILTEHDIEIEISLNDGAENCTAWGCDLSYDYVKINGDYRS
jgi:glutamate N-acetyltransferase/amino-acid N-acetyltransferase